MYHVVGYRKSVVRNNLKVSFPDNSANELRKIERKYFQYLSDLIVEVIKGKGMSEKNIQKRVSFSDPKYWEQLAESGKPVVMAMGHYGNWEWLCMASTLLQKSPVNVIYKTLSDDDFERYMNSIRGKTGANLIPMEKVLRPMLNTKDKSSVNCFVADQNPSSGEKAYWLKFLNQDTAVLKGTEKIAKLLNCEVVYVEMERVKRGHYLVHTKSLANDCKFLPEGEVTKLYMSALEESIKKRPEWWLWSHKRWKHKVKEDSYFI
jgi:KDO2-lipid IV(A) lauroyltransferase